MKEFFKLYGFVLLITIGVVLFFATTIGLVAVSVILCVVYETGKWAFLLIPLLFTIPFWVCVYICTIKN